MPFRPFPLDSRGRIYFIGWFLLLLSLLPSGDTEHEQVVWIRRHNGSLQLRVFQCNPMNRNSLIVENFCRRWVTADVHAYWLGLHRRGNQNGVCGVLAHLEIYLHFLRQTDHWSRGYVLRSLHDYHRADRACPNPPNASA